MLLLLCTYINMCRTISHMPLPLLSQPLDGDVHVRCSHWPYCLFPRTHQARRYHGNTQLHRISEVCNPYLCFGSTTCAGAAFHPGVPHANDDAHRMRPHCAHLPCLHGALLCTLLRCVE